MTIIGGLIGVFIVSRNTSKDSEVKRLLTIIDRMQKEIERLDATNDCLVRESSQFQQWAGRLAKQIVNLGAVPEKLNGVKLDDKS